jgi:hypothetical protein
MASNPIDLGLKRMWCIYHERDCMMFTTIEGERYHIEPVVQKDELTGTVYSYTEVCRGPFEELPPPPSLDEYEWSILLLWADTLPETEMM